MASGRSWAMAHRWRYGIWVGKRIPLPAHGSPLPEVGTLSPPFTPLMTTSHRRLSRVPVYAPSCSPWRYGYGVVVTVEPPPRLLFAIVIAALPLAAPERGFRGVTGVALLGVGRLLAPAAFALAAAVFRPGRSAE